MTRQPRAGGLLSAAEARSLREAMDRSGRQLVWTNGCFDLLHAGHVAYLAQARSLGDALIVGLNSDRSYRRWKKRPGPVNPQRQRAAVLLGLAAVDHVVIFDQVSPRSLLESIQPHIFVKGDDYTLDSLDAGERTAVQGYGGAIRFCSGEAGVSTSKMLARILSLYEGDDIAP